MIIHFIAHLYLITHSRQVVVVFTANKTCASLEVATLAEALGETPTHRKAACAASGCIHYFLHT